ncbi:MAG: hypothetical protein CL920_32220 [Deltaproteobacteria bacterium]|nr:hypothetical protein [Deltaproteobacteria bacterium]MBU53386.1 hypothetical protein [Deltaproteobacteria bacterium]
MYGYSDENKPMNARILGYEWPYTQVKTWAYTKGYAMPTASQPLGLGRSKDLPSTQNLSQRS